jgi:hypothetical protein
MAMLPPGPLPNFVALGPVAYTVQSKYGRARAIAKINGQFYNIKSYDITKAVHGATNTASFVLPYNGNPDWTGQLFRGTAAGVTDNSPVYVELWAGFPPNPTAAADNSGMSRRFYGIVDIYSPDGSETTEFKCRSIAAPLCTDRISTAIQNMTTVQFLEQVAAKYNIATNVDPSLSEPFTLAKVYAQDFVVGLKNFIYWDILVRSAAVDDVDLWEDDGVLNYFHPWNVKRLTIPLVYGTNVKAFKPSHAPQFNRNIVVYVHSYTDKTRTSVTTRVQTLLNSLVPGIEVSQIVKVSTSTPQWGTNGYTTTTFLANGTQSTTTSSSQGGAASGSNQAIAESGREKYEIYLPNLTAAECQALTMSIWRQISMHEYQGNFTLAMTPDFLPLCNITSLIDLQGYGMARFNTQYWPREMHEVFEGAEPESSEAGGWTVDFNAVNHTPPMGGV